MTGWIKVFRAFQEWEYYASINHTRLFLHLLLRANYRETVWRKERVKPGELLTGRKKLAQETGLSEGQIYRALNDLSNSGEINIRSTNKFSIITIVNWEKYQSSEQQTEQRTEQQTKQQTNTSKEVKKKRNNNIAQFDFDSFYSGYPRKEGKKKGRDKFENQITSQEKYDRLCNALENYKQLLRDEGRGKSYTKSFATFMNNWEDYEDYKSEKTEANEKLGEMLRW